jgi:hypothetical protein
MNRHELFNRSDIQLFSIQKTGITCVISPDDRGMTVMMKMILGAVLAVTIAFGMGWLWGSSGRSETDRGLQQAELRSELLGARAAALDARVAIYSVNFGEASGHLENSRGLVRRAEARLTALGREEQAKKLQQVAASIDEAQRLAGAMDQAANTRAGDAARVLVEVLNAIAVP